MIENLHCQSCREKFVKYSFNKERMIVSILLCYHVFVFCDNLISQCFKMEPIISTSSTEAGYRVVTYTMQDAT